MIPSHIKPNIFLNHNHSLGIGRPNINNFSRLSPSQFEINLRKEMDIILYGDSQCSPKSSEVVLRSTDRSQRCSCWNSSTEESDSGCDNCGGGGFLARDFFIRCTSSKFIGRNLDSELGSFQYESFNFYFRYDTKIQEGDQLFEVHTDDLGRHIEPVSIIKRLNVVDVVRYHGTNGRVEYIRIFASRSD